MKNLNLILEKEELTAQADDAFKMVSVFKKKYQQTNKTNPHNYLVSTSVL